MLAVISGICSEFAALDLVVCGIEGENGADARNRIPVCGTKSANRISSTPTTRSSSRPSWRWRGHGALSKAAPRFPFAEGLSGKRRKRGTLYAGGTRFAPLHPVRDAGIRSGKGSGWCRSCISTARGGRRRRRCFSRIAKRKAGRQTHNLGSTAGNDPRHRPAGRSERRRSLGRGLADKFRHPPAKDRPQPVAALHGN